MIKALRANKKQIIAKFCLKIQLFALNFSKFDEFGRQEGIWTLESFHFTRVPGVLLQPLGHLSIKNLSKNLTIFSKINQNCSKIMYNFNLFLQNSQRKPAKAKPCSLKCGSVAQLVEHHLDMVVVVGSSPIGATIYFYLNFLSFSNLAFKWLYVKLQNVFDNF